MLRDYSQDILDLFKSAVEGDRKAFKRLMTTEKHPELAAFSNAVKGDESAEMWLKARYSADWWLVCRALDYEEPAFQQLQNKEDKFYVSFVLACQKRIEGKYWLAHNDYSRFLPICEAIADAVYAKDGDTIWYYRIFN